MKGDYENMVYAIAYSDKNGKDFCENIRGYWMIFLLNMKQKKEQISLSKRVIKM